MQQASVRAQQTAEDVYSFGVLLWFLAHKTDPNTAVLETAEEKTGQGWTTGPVAAVRAGHRPAVQEELCPGGPGSSYVSIMKRCWSPSPRDRPSWSEVVSALEDSAVFPASLCPEYGPTAAHHGAGVSLVGTWKARLSDLPSVAQLQQPIYPITGVMEQPLLPLRDSLLRVREAKLVPPSKLDTGVYWALQNAQRIVAADHKENPQLQAGMDREGLTVDEIGAINLYTQVCLLGCRCVCGCGCVAAREPGPVCV